MFFPPNYRQIALSQVKIQGTRIKFRSHEYSSPVWGAAHPSSARSTGTIFSRKTIPLTIIEEDSYEKDVLFYVQLGEPQMSGGKISINVSAVLLSSYQFFFILSSALPLTTRSR
jgi:hypothetical protein